MFSKSAGVAFLCAAAVTLFGSVPSVSAQESARASSPATAHSNAPASTPYVPVFYDPALAAKGFPNPLVKARIAGHEAIFIVDTGASTNTLADWLVEAARIPSAETNMTARGAGGQTVPIRRVHRLRGLWSDGQEFTLDEGIVLAFPPYFKSMKIGGLVTPQLLGPGGTAAVMDLRIPSLQFVPFAQALSDLRRSKGPTVAIDLTQPCRNPSSRFVNRSYVAPVTVAGVSDLLQVDTGSTATTFSEESKIARILESGGKTAMPIDGTGATQSVGGALNEERAVRNVQMLRGGGTVALESVSIGQGLSVPCDAKGMLGMDALRSCVLILGDSEMALSCE